MALLALLVLLNPVLAGEPGIAFPGQWAPTPADWKYPVWPQGCDGRPDADRAACLAFVVEDYGRLARFAGANALLPPPRAGERRVVFFGDSITDNWSSPGFGGFFPGRRYVNRGIGGQATSQMLLRFRADVVALEPQAVVILAGTNDIAGNAGPMSLAATEQNLATMAELAAAHGIKVVLASLLPVGDDKKDEAGKPLVQSASRPPASIHAVNEWLADYARQHGHQYLDYFGAMATADGRLKSVLTDDGLHPNAAGYAVMRPLAEAAVARALGER